MESCSSLGIVSDIATFSSFATFSIHMMVWLVWFSLLYIFGSTWLEKDLNKRNLKAQKGNNLIWKKI